jgi:cadmium resistance protein CadD (predicted permease)
MHWPARVVEACGLFVGTNTDDLLLLFAWNADRRIPFRRILLGQWLGIGSLLAASLLLGQWAARLPPVAIRLLGVVPLLLGFYNAVQARRRHLAEEQPKAGAAESVLAITVVTVASGGDNLAAYIPVFAAGYHGLVVYVAVFSCMTLLWCVGARMLVQHPVVRTSIERAGSWLTPLVLVVVGILVLLG